MARGEQVPGHGPAHDAQSNESNVLWHGFRAGSYVEEWKYVNPRRHFIYEKRSIDAGTQWAVFEPKGDGQAETR
jgi:phage tail sheath protein FI